jgi:hypothetical protein
MAIGSTYAASGKNRGMTSSGVPAVPQEYGNQQAVGHEDARAGMVQSREDPREHPADSLALRLSAAGRVLVSAMLIEPGGVFEERTSFEFPVVEFVQPRVGDQVRPGTPISNLAVC